MYSVVLLGLLGLTTAQIPTFPSAPVITKNAPGVTYSAEFDGNDGSGIKGYVTVSSNVNGTGTVVNVNLGNLPNQSPGGPFLYHIHVAPVGPNHNCTAALAHLDPTNRGEQPPCDPSQPATCQAGDLAGKFGKMTTTPWQQVYVDLFTSTTPGDAAFVGNRSIVVHDLNTTRIACSNFKLLSPAASDCSVGGSASASAVGVFPTGTDVQAPGAARASGAAVQSAGASSGTGSSSGSAGTVPGSSASGVVGPKPSASNPIVPSSDAGRIVTSLSVVGLAVLAFIL